jgi:hypothetical protein
VNLFHTPEKIGPKRGRTPEGYLVCYDVPLARVGFQEYGEHEIDDPAISRPPDGFYRVERVPDEVFAPDSIASWNGKPVTNDHPPQLLTPATTRMYQVGTMINPRRGEGGNDGLMLVDMVITCPSTMLDIESGKREVSGGYGCDYFEITPGHLQQRNILGNHGAIVEEGRCGGACAIHDHKPKSLAFDEEADIRRQIRERGTTMNKIFDALTKAFKARDDKAFEQAQAALAIMVKDEEHPSVKTEGGSHEIHLHLEGGGSKREEEPPPHKEDPMDEAPEWFKKFGQEHDSFKKGFDEWRKSVDAFMKGGAQGEEAGDEANKKIEGELEEEAPPGTALKDAKGAKDSAYLVDSFHETVAGAEVLAPGISLPTLDRSAQPKVTFDSICGLRRKALDHAAAQMETREMLTAVTGGRAFDTKMATCRDVRNVFRGVVALKRAANARGTAGTGATDIGRNAHSVVGGFKSLAELNAANTAAYAKGDHKVASR